MHEEHVQKMALDLEGMKMQHEEKKLQLEIERLKLQVEATKAETRKMEAEAMLLANSKQIACVAGVSSAELGRGGCALGGQCLIIQAPFWGQQQAA